MSCEDLCFGAPSLLLVGYSGTCMLPKQSAENRGLQLSDGPAGPAGGVGRCIAECMTVQDQYDVVDPCAKLLHRFNSHNLLPSRTVGRGPLKKISDPINFKFLQHAFVASEDRKPVHGGHIWTGSLLFFLVIIGKHRWRCRYIARRKELCDFSELVNYAEFRLPRI